LGVALSRDGFAKARGADLGVLAASEAKENGGACGVAARIGQARALAHVHKQVAGLSRPWFRAIIDLFCDLQNARLWLFRPLAQVIHPPIFNFEPGETTRKTP
jgi:hypothetical protein